MNEKVSAEIEQRLTDLVLTMKGDCDGQLPRCESDLFLEDVCRCLGLSDSAILRVLAADHLPSERVLALVPSQAVIDQTGEPLRSKLQSWRDYVVHGKPLQSTQVITGEVGANDGDRLSAAL